MFEVFITSTSSKQQHKLPVALFKKSFTALSIGPCGKLPQNWRAPSPTVKRLYDIGCTDLY